MYRNLEDKSKRKTLVLEVMRTDMYRNTKKVH